MERLQKVIAESGIASRRKAEELISKGKVSVNGKIVTKLGIKVSDTDEIIVNNKRLKKEENVVFIFNKPKNVISSCKDDKGRKTVLDFIDEPYRLYPLGRLDYDSSGLLILTNNGELTNKILHPKYKIEKEYEVVINKILESNVIQTIESGIMIDGYKTAPCKIKIKKINNNKRKTFLNITLHEGRNREIRKIFKKYNADVIKLNRIREANITLGNLKQGEYRKIKLHELTVLKKYLNSIDR